MIADYVNMDSGVNSITEPRDIIPLSFIYWLKTFTWCLWGRIRFQTPASSFPPQ